MDSQSHQFQVPNKPRQMPQSQVRRVIAVSVRPLEDREWSADCLDRNGRSLLHALFFFCLSVIDFRTSLSSATEPDNTLGTSGSDSCIYLAGKERLAVFGPKFSLKV